MTTMTATMVTMTADMATIQNTLEELKTEANAKFDRLIAATPGAADIPAVFVPGDQDAAQRRGSKEDDSGLPETEIEV